MLKSGWLNINKPSEYTSAKIVAVLKKKLHCKKIGHGGTLDPFASGVLPICINSATKTVEYVMDHSKTYLFHLTFGKSTDSFDIDGKVIETNNIFPKESDIINILPNFIGKIRQTPPKYSAIKINGSRACDLMREGIDVELNDREIDIFDLKLSRVINENTFEFIVDCGRGCYIRSLGNDIANNLGMLAYVSKLVRQRVGQFNIENSISIDNFDNITDNNVISIDDILDMPEYNCSKEEYIKLKNGEGVFKPELGEEQQYKIKFNDEVVSISCTNDNCVLKSVKWLNSFSD